VQERNPAGKAPLPLLYNGLVETAARVHLVLYAFYGKALSFEELRLLDFFAVFPGDLGAPINVHPPLQGRAGAYSIRPEAIRRSLGLLEGLGFVEAGPEARGPCCLNGNGASVEAYLRHSYWKAVHASAQWLRETMDGQGRESFFARLAGRLADLAAGPSGGPDGQTERFAGLAECYRSDLQRSLAIEEAAWMYGLFARNGKPASGSVPGEDWFLGVQRAAEAEHARVASLSAGLESLMAR